MPLTVFERWTDYGEELMLKAIINQGEPLTVFLRLFTSPTTDTADETPTIVEADFQGYPVGGIAVSWASATGPSEWQSIGSLCVFTREWQVPPPDPDPIAGTSNTVYGYYLTSVNTGHDTEEPIYYRFFNDGVDITPKDMNTPEVDQISIIPRIGLIGLEDVECPE